MWIIKQHNRFLHLSHLTLIFIGQYDLQSQGQDIHIQERLEGSEPNTTSSKVITRC